MLEQNEYLVTWAVYYGAALGVLLVWWRMTKPIPWVPLKQLLRVLLAAAVLVPAPVDSQSIELAPALFVLLFDLLLIQEGDALRASVYLLYGVVLGLVALIIDGLIRMAWRRARANA
ncbi:MAG: MFS transporter [Gammaproteobacteria bacterium]